jgi:hypothetical protein
MSFSVLNILLTGFAAVIILLLQDLRFFNVKNLAVSKIILNTQ